MFNNITEEMIKIKENCFVNQTSYNDCGLACLTMILKSYGLKVELHNLKREFSTEDKMISVYDLIKISNKKGVKATGYKNVSLENTKPLCIAHLIDNDKQHFVVLIKVLKNKVLIADPSRRIMYVDKNSFIKKYTGVMITFEKKKQIVNVVLKNKKMIFKTIFLSVLLCLFNVLFSFMLPSAINLINAGKKFQFVILTLLLFLLIGILKDLLNYVKTNFSLKFQLFIDRFITIPTIENIINLPHEFYHENGSGELIAKINDLSFIKEAIFNFVEVVILNLLLIIFTIIIFLCTDFYIFVLTVLFIFISYLINRFYVLKNLNKSYDIQFLNEKFSNKLTDSLNFILTIKNLGKETFFINKINSSYNDVLKKYKEVCKAYQKKELLMNIIITFFTILILTLLVIKNNSLSNILFLFSLETMMINSVLEIYKLLPLYMDFKNVYTRLNNALKKVEVSNDLDKININKIVIKNLKYDYDNKPVLKGISLKIKKGDWIMVNGPTGSGKSTLFKILTKQIEYNGDSIFINETKISNLDFSIIRNSIVYVDQKIKLINESIKDNVFLGDKFNNKVVLTSEISSFLKENNINYDYVIDNTNSNISAGQAGKIAIARALNTKRNFIILDETTSSMDVLTEEKILDNIKKNYKDKTIILITHRKSNIKYFNKIVTFKDGKIKQIIGGKNGKINV